MTLVHPTSSDSSHFNEIKREISKPDDQELSTLTKIIGIAGLVLALLGLAVISTVDAKDLVVSGTAMSLGGSFIALCGFQNLFASSENYLSFLYNRVRHLDF